ncbi:GNAT family N-acetyltransferase [bacterium]|nr:GNAT family N-acetyltransferase [bacterium]MBU1652018.1 GNAT family N-acetyltransferase [bacterium]MBU1881654.1 GNAT family N-acetyltransferase [bacterium]
MNIEYRSHYFDDIATKTSFKKYADAIFGLDFSRWEAKGLWDSQYVPFSAFIDGKCIASICVYPSEITIDGKKERWAQLLTVGTLPEYRHRGIHYELWKRAHAWIQESCRLTFLFTDDDVVGFYERLGFKRQLEYFDAIVLEATASVDAPQSKKLDIANSADYALIARLVEQREPVSQKLGFHTPNLLLFMLLYPYVDLTYYIEELDTVVIAEQTADGIRIHDVIAPKMPTFAELEPFFRQFGSRHIDFLFCTDKLGLRDCVKKMVTESALMVSDEFDYPSDYVFPFSIRA